MSALGRFHCNHGVPLQQLNLDASNQRLYQKVLHHDSFFWNLANIFQERYRKTFWIAKKILSKEIKQILQRRVKVHELQRNLQKNPNKTKQKRNKQTTWNFIRILYCKNFSNFLSEFLFQWTGIRLSCCYVLEMPLGIGRETCSYKASDSEKGRAIKQTRVVEVVKSMVGI